jgi:hypothetical protein
LYEKYNYWFNTILEINFGSEYDENIVKVREFEIKSEESKFQFYLAEGRINIFVKNYEITKALGELVSKTLQMCSMVGNYIIKHRSLFKENKQKIKNISDTEDLANVFEQITEKRKNLLTDFGNDKQNIYIEILPLQSKLQNLIYNHIQNMVEN